MRLEVEGLMSARRPKDLALSDDRQTLIHFVSAMYGNARRYRCTHAREQLQWYGWSSAFSPLTAGHDPSIIASARVIVLHRVPHDRYVEALQQKARARGCLCLYDTDDLNFDDRILPYLADPALNWSWRAARQLEDIWRCRRTLESCDGALVSTEYLVERVRATSRPAWVHRNAFSLEMLAHAEQAHQEITQASDRVVIGYVSGTPTHDRDFATVRPVLQRVLQAYPQVELRVLGLLTLTDDWGPYRDRVTYLPFVPWYDVPRILAQFDINIAPLELNNPFCQSKSEIKYVEAGLVRVPTIASATDAFRYAIRHGENGMLVQTERDWEMAFARLIEDAEMRRWLGEQAYTDVLARYHPAVRGCELLTTLDEISRAITGRPLCPDLAEPAPVPPTSVLSLNDGVPSLPRRVWYAARYRGVRTLALQVLVYLQDRWWKSDD